MSKINEIMSSAVTPESLMAQASAVRPQGRGKELAGRIHDDIFHNPQQSSASPQGRAQAIEQVLEKNNASDEELMSNLGHIVDHLERGDEYGLGEMYLQSYILTAIHSIKQKREGEAELRPLLVRHAALASLKKEELWRMAIDGQRQGSGNLYQFDNEAGYYGAICKGLAHVVKTLGEKMDKHSYERLHGICVDQVGVQDVSIVQEGNESHSPFKFEKVLGKGYRDKDHATSFQLILPGVNPDWTTATDKGIAELEKKYQGDDWADVRIAKHRHTLKITGRHVGFRRTTKAECQARVAKIFNNYYQAIAVAGDDSSKRRVILKCGQDLTQTHVFSDGNIRTVNLVVNKLLMENELSPVIFEDPNRLDGYDMDALEQELLAGQATFQSFCNPPDDLVPAAAQQV